MLELSVQEILSVVYLPVLPRYVCQHRAHVHVRTSDKIQAVLIKEVSILILEVDLYTKVYYWDLRNCPD